MARTKKPLSPHRQAIAEMSELERLVFVMVLYDGLSIPKAAEVLSETPRKTRTIFNRAINRFRSRKILQELARRN